MKRDCPELRGGGGGRPSGRYGGDRRDRMRRDWSRSRSRSDDRRRDYRREEHRPRMEMSGSPIRRGHHASRSRSQDRFGPRD